MINDATQIFVAGGLGLLIALVFGIILLTAYILGSIAEFVFFVTVATLLWVEQKKHTWKFND